MDFPCLNHLMKNRQTDRLILQATQAYCKVVVCKRILDRLD